jgi:hypothetical protein
MMNEQRDGIIRTVEDLHFSPEEGRLYLLNCPRLWEWKEKKGQCLGNLSHPVIFWYIEKWMRREIKTN